MSGDAVHLVVVSAGLSQPSSSRLLADRLTEAARSFLTEDVRDVDVRVIELRDHAVAIANNLVTGLPAPALAEAIDALVAADGVIAVTPIFTASYSGLFKSFFDCVEPDALAGTPVLLGATGGTARHSLALEHALRPLFAYLHAVPAPTAVFAATEDWGATGEREGDLVLRIGRAAREFADLVDRRVAARTALRRVDPPEADELFVVPFEEQLARMRDLG